MLFYLEIYFPLLCKQKKTESFQFSLLFYEIHIEQIAMCSFKLLQIQVYVILRKVNKIDRTKAKTAEWTNQNALMNAIGWIKKK